MEAAYKFRPDRIAVTPPPAEKERGHLVLFYEQDDFLLESLTRVVGGALAASEPAIMVATTEHRDALADRLYRRGLDVAEYIRCGLYIELDAEETMAGFMTTAGPDPLRFSILVGGLLDRVKRTTKITQPITVYGEMVALLWQDGKREEAIQLEQLWNELAEIHPITLFCGYSLGSFPNPDESESFRRICVHHTAVAPSEGYAQLLNLSDRLRSIASLQQKVQVLEPENQSRQSEIRFRKLVNAVHDCAIFSMDTLGRVVTWNVGAERILGYREADVLGRHFSRFYTDEDALGGKPRWQLQVASHEGRHEERSWLVRRDGREFLANVALTALRDEAGGVIGYAAVAREINVADASRANHGPEPVDRPASADTFLESEESLRQFSLFVLRRQEEERKLVGGNLLDNLGQYLSVLKMKLDSMSLLGDECGGRGDEELGQCLNLVEGAIEEIRTISYQLYPPLLEELGLKTVIPWYLENFSKQTGIRTTFRISPGFLRLTNDANLAIFRVLQEALSNVQRHSGSTTADVQLLTSNESVVLIVGDTGKGIPPEYLIASRRGPSTRGMGLRGMSERIRYLGGKLEITSSGRGATVTAAVPLACCGAAAISS